jgi:hypothetical protein
MTKGTGLRSSRFFHDSCLAMSWVIAPVALLGTVCIPHADCGGHLSVRGGLMEAGSGVAMAGAIVGARSFRNGAEASNVPPLNFDGTPNLPPSDTDGAFGISISTYFGPCPAPEFPKPDQVEIIVIHEGCEQRFMIEINEDTAQFVDGEFPGDQVLELTDPILVPPCDVPP